jgi:hypothetical protein
MVSFLRHSNLDDREFQAFLVANGVDRVELDNVAQGYSLQLDERIRASLYVPYVYVASGRKCLFARMEDRVDAYRSGRTCDRTCRGLVLWGQVGDTDERILMSGNAHYLENAVVPARPQAWNVDRFVDCSILGAPDRSADRRLSSSVERSGDS